MTDMSPPPVITQEVRIVDTQGQPHIVLSAKNGVPIIILLRDDGKTGASLALDRAGRPAVTLENPTTDGPTAKLEIDDKGAHVKFDRPGAASAYLFLNNAGGSGVVLIDRGGQRRLQATVAGDGTTQILQPDK